MFLQSKDRTERPPESGGDTLSALLAREQQLASRLDAATLEAEQIRREAEEYARRTESGRAATIEGRITALVAEQERKLEEELRGIESAAAKEMARLDDIGDTRVNELAILVLRRIGALDSAPPGESQS